VKVQSPHSTRRFWLLWLPTFLGLPLGGLAASLTVGPIQTPLEALVGGALAGAIIGLAQWLALRSLYGVRPVWILSTALGLALGLTVGVALFGTVTNTVTNTFTDTLTLLARGFVTGLGVGAAQAFALRDLSFPLWTLAVALLWALAWPLTGLVIGASLENDYAVFGASGALFFTLMSGVALRTLRRS
jgi:hypothetical protein